MLTVICCNGNMITLNGTNRITKNAKRPGRVTDTVTDADVQKMLERYHYPTETREIIESERLLPTGVLSRLQATYPHRSGLLEFEPFLFNGCAQYSGIQGFREVLRILAANGIHLGDIPERELFVEVYRFKATRHILNTINWKQYETDSMFRLVFPQPGIMRKGVKDAWLAAKTDKQRQKIISD